MQYLPLFADLRQRRCLVIGGGAVAERKISMLRRAASTIVVVAPELTPRLRQWVTDGDLVWRAREFNVADMDGMHLVIAATDNAVTHRAAAAAARRVGCLFNAVDQPALSNFISPAIVDRSPLVIAISSGGAMPVLARRVRAWLERLLPEGLGRLAQTAGRWRGAVSEKIDDLIQRRHFWESVLDRGLLAPERGEQLIRDALDGAAPATGQVFLVGAGPGDPDLLTLKAARILQQADVILYDRLVAPEILEHARRDAEMIDVGKKAGDHRFTQSHINRLLIEQARTGRVVCRLKGGDPGLFGRASEELRALRKAGIPVQIVPGITAAQGCAAAAGFSLTDRGRAHSLLLATAHRADEELDLPAIDGSADQTTVWYMPVSNLDRLARRLIAQGVEANTPVALVENGTRPEQRVIRGALRYIGQDAAQAGIASPALLIVGGVTEDGDVESVAHAVPASLSAA